jgi:hypothetical protein
MPNPTNHPLNHAFLPSLFSLRFQETLVDLDLFGNIGNIDSAVLNWDCIKEHRATALAALQGIVRYAALKAHRQDCPNTVALMLSASAEEMSRSNLAHTPSQQSQQQHHAALTHPHSNSAAPFIVIFMHVQVQTGVHA